MKFRVRLGFDHLQAGDKIIEADSIETANKLAEAMTVDDIDEWRGIDGEVFVDSVEEVREDEIEEYAIIITPRRT